MRTGSGPVVALQNIAVQTLREDTVCIQTCKRAFLRVETCARFMNRDARQLSFYSATAFFRRQGRLTGFGSARNIICTRTNTPAAMDRI
jgi:hypothetical protein